MHWDTTISSEYGVHELEVSKYLDIALSDCRVQHNLLVEQTYQKSEIISHFKKINAKSDIQNLMSKTGLAQSTWIWDFEYFAL